MGTAANGRQALRRVTALEPDLVFMDVRLPGMSGLKATRRIKARNDGSVAIIIMTADDHPGCRAAAKAAGADGFVGKTASMFTALQSTIRRLFPCAQLWSSKPKQTSRGYRVHRRATPRERHNEDRRRNELCRLP